MTGMAAPAGMEPSACAPYDGSMRRGFYILMMLVLVLRGLTGTAMAAGVVAPMQPASPLAFVAAGHAAHTAHHSAANGAVHGHAQDHRHDSGVHTAAKAPAQDGHAAKVPCHGTDHASAATAGAAHMAGAHHPGESTCSVCEICHSAMLALPLVQAGTPARTGTLLPDASAQFHSAPAALAFEPPIA